MGGNPHYSPSAVFVQHVIGDPDGNLFPGKGINRHPPSGNAPLGFIFGGAIEFALVPHFFDKRFYSLFSIGSGDARGEGMFRGQHHVGDTANGIGTGGKYADFLVTTDDGKL